MARRLLGLTAVLLALGLAPSLDAQDTPRPPLPLAPLNRLTGVVLVRFGKRVQVQALTTRPATVRHGWAGGASGRLFVDVHGARVTPETVVPLPPPGTVVGRVRVAQLKEAPPVARIVLELKPGFRPHQSSPPGRPPAVVSFPGGAPRRSVGAARLRTRAASPRSVRSFIIAIDAGHGGRDPGARGPRGLQEKRVALDVARRLAETLRRKGHRVHLSRANDRSLTPAMRTAWLRRTRSHALVSIHCDAMPSRTYRGGPSTYYPASHASSRRLAGAVQRGVIRATGARDQGVRADTTRFSQGFYVLRRARRPAVLVEVGYISNAATERLLGTAAYRQKLAEGISCGVLAYLS